MLHNFDDIVFLIYCYIIILFELNHKLASTWFHFSESIPNNLSVFIPAFSRISDEMENHGYGGRISLVKNIMAANFLISIISLLVELLFSMVTYFISDQYVYKNLLQRLNNLSNKKNGNNFNILKSRFLVFSGFILGNLLIYSGLSFIFPKPLYSDDYKLLFLCLICNGGLGINFGFMIYFFILPFWVRGTRRV